MYLSFFKLFSVLEFKEKRNLVLLFLVKTFSAILDMIGVVSVAPVILVITKSEVLNTNKYILLIKELTNFNNQELTIFFILLSVSLIFISILMRIFATWGASYVSINIWFNCVKKIYNYYLNKPYNFFLKNSSNELLEKLVIRVNDGIHQIISSFYLILGSLFSLMFITIFLLFVDIKATLIIFAVVFFFYFFIYQKIKKVIDKYGKFIPDFSKKTFKTVDQSFKSIKDIKIFQNQDFYKKKYSSLQKIYKDSSIQMSLINSLPRSIFEIVIFLLIYFLIFFLFVIQSQNLTEILLIVGLYAISLQRMIPAAQSIFQGISDLKVANYSFDIIFPDLKLANNESQKKEFNKQTNLSLNNLIKFKDVKFDYEKKDKKKLLEIESLSIETKKIIGITGFSGAGKSTFIDIFCGLLEPNSGEIYIDNKLVPYAEYKNISSKIAYVSQFPYIADDSIINNIGLGENPKEIDLERVKECCEIVGLKNFIENNLELKYDTLIGEDGIRFSGGQRQRICLARALYRNKDILILDEATNSLDEAGEREIMIDLKRIFKDKLIIFITHRISALNICDEMLIFNQGRIVYNGSHNLIDAKNQKILSLMSNNINLN